MHFYYEYLVMPDVGFDFYWFFWLWCFLKLIGMLDFTTNLVCSVAITSAFLCTIFYVYFLLTVSFLFRTWCKLLLSLRKLISSRKFNIPVDQHWETSELSKDNAPSPEIEPVSTRCEDKCVTGNVSKIFITCKFERKKIFSLVQNFLPWNISLKRI